MYIKVHTVPANDELLVNCGMLVEISSSPSGSVLEYSNGKTTTVSESMEDIYYKIVRCNKSAQYHRI